MSTRLLRSEGAIERIAKRLVRMKHPELTSQEISELAKRKEFVDEAVYQIKVADLQDRLFEEYGETQPSWVCRDQAIEWMTKLPEELLLNVEEWLDNKPLSDIKVHGISINDIFSKYKSPNLTMTRVMSFFILWKETGFKNENAHVMFFTMR